MVGKRMLECLREFFRLFFSIPVLAFINVLLATLSLAAAFNVDEKDLSLICDIDNIEAMIFTSISSLQIIVADTAVSLMAAELGIPDFMGSFMFPLFFTVVWLFKVLDSRDELTYLINGFLSILTISAIVIGFTSKSIFWVDTEKIKSNIVQKQFFLDGVKHDAKYIKEDFLNNLDENACYIGLEMYTLAIEDVCAEQTISDCYLEMLADEELKNMITDKTKAWVFKGTRFDK